MDSLYLLKLKDGSTMQNSEDLKNVVSPSSSMVSVVEDSSEKKKRTSKKNVGEEGKRSHC